MKTIVKLVSIPSLLQLKKLNSIKYQVKKCIDNLNKNIREIFSLGTERSREKVFGA